MSLSFFLDNRQISEIDFTSVELGNPGSGGTEYSFVNCANELSKIGIPLTLFITRKGKFPENVSIKIVKNFREAAEISALNSQILIYKPHTTIPDLRHELDKEIEYCLAPWLHITPSQEQLRQMAKDTRIKAVIVMGRNQAKQLYDNPIWSKCVILRNPINLPKRGMSQMQVVTKEPFRVVYVGALVPQKGFHILAETWPKVVKKVPNAELIVIGSSKLYRRIDSEGSLVASETDYERTVRERLGVHMNSVKFMGLVSNQKKIQILLSSCVGVVNPSGQTEVMSSSALEMQSLGIPVVSKRKNGMVDVVLDKKTGILIRSNRQLARALVNILLDSDLQKEFSEAAANFARVVFDTSAIIHDWKRFDISHTNKQISCCLGEKLEKRSIYDFLLHFNKMIQPTFGYRLPTIREYFETASRVYHRLKD